MQTDKEKIKELEAKIGQIREHTKNFPRDDRNLKKWHGEVLGWREEHQELVEENQNERSS